jgi:hypothetical protein
MTYHIFLDESKRGDWFVIAGLFLSDAELSREDRAFLRELHATDDRGGRRRENKQEGDRKYQSNLRRVIEILAPRRHKVLYSVRSLSMPVRIPQDVPLQFAGIKSVLAPLLPFFGRDSWQVTVEQFGGFFQDASGRRPDEREENRDRKASRRAIQEYLKGEVRNVTGSLCGLSSEINLKLSFASSTNEPWLGAADYLAYSISDHWCKRGVETPELQRRLAPLSLVRVDA